jgi:hypothetical protein
VSKLVQSEVQHGISNPQLERVSVGVISHLHSVIDIIQDTEGKDYSLKIEKFKDEEVRVHRDLLNRFIPRFRAASLDQMQESASKVHFDLLVQKLNSWILLI